MTLILGDCAVELEKINTDSIDLIYLDPPFFIQKDHISCDTNNKYYMFY